MFTVFPPDSSINIVGDEIKTSDDIDLAQPTTDTGMNNIL